jgi:hypothetical protein
LGDIKMSSNVNKKSIEDVVSDHKNTINAVKKEAEKFQKNQNVELAVSKDAVKKTINDSLASEGLEVAAYVNMDTYLKIHEFFLKNPNAKECKIDYDIREIKS